MIASQIYIAISIVVLAIITLLVFFLSKRKKNKKLTPLAGLAFGFVLAGIIFSEDRLRNLARNPIGLPHQRQGVPSGIG